jgi:predicted RNA-binding protein YlxR (DUF448 family)
MRIPKSLGRPETRAELALEDIDLETEARETGPQRRCVVTRERDDKERMVRFVVGPERNLVPDLRAALPGRGFWLSARRDVLETALTKGGFARAARGVVTLPADLPGLLIAGLERRIAETLGLARRAGQAVAGFKKAREWIDDGRAALVVEASDGSVEERARFLAWRTDAAGDAPAPVRGFQGAVILPLDAAGLGTLFGRDHSVHVAVAAGRLADLLLCETERLAGISGRPGLIEYQVNKRANV